jgi:hypothetical protein
MAQQVHRVSGKILASRFVACKKSFFAATHFFILTTSHHITPFFLLL